MPRRLAGHSGDAFLNPFTEKLAQDCVNTSLTRSAPEAGGSTSSLHPDGIQKKHGGTPGDPGWRRF
jgi:hypothetical protein